MSDQFAGAAFGRAHEAPEEVVIGRAVAETEGLQPEDLGVLVYLLLLAPGALASAKDLAAGMRAMGWKMSVDRFEVIAKRLSRAGHLSRESVYDSNAKRPQWRYWAYRNPANNPGYVQDGATALAQVNAGIGDSPVSETSAMRETGDSPVWAGQSRNGVFPDIGKSRTSDSSVSAGQVGNRGFPGSGVHPPHPPEGVVTPSPYPLSTADEGREGEECSAVAEQQASVDAAYNFLQDLPEPWRAGRATARRLAPKLAEVIAEQGWSLDADLQRKLCEKPDGVKLFPKVLAARIDDLPRRGRAQVPLARSERTSVQKDILEGREKGMNSADAIAAARAALKGGLGSLTKSV